MGIGVLLLFQPSSFAHQGGPGPAMTQEMMMQMCQQQHQQMLQRIDQMRAMMARARQTNDPAQMRMALDQAQQSLDQMRQQMGMCCMMQPAPSATASPPVHQHE